MKCGKLSPNNVARKNCISPLGIPANPFQTTFTTLPLLRDVVWIGGQGN